MKKMMLSVIALVAAMTISAQEPPRFDFKKPDSLRLGKWTLPDSLAHAMPWQPELKGYSLTKTKPAVSMTSVVVVQKENMPKSVTVINNNTLRLGPHFTLGNGQAWSNGPFPDAFLDARTLSFPMPR